MNIRSSDEYAVVCRAVRKEFGDGDTRRAVLDDITMGVGAGELTMVVGPSGCGKTTLISIMAGILSPTAGQVWLFGADLNALAGATLSRFRLNNIGFVFQQFNLLPTLTAAENAGVPLAAAGMPRRRATDRGAAMLERLGLSAHADKRPSQLSGGQQQRVAIARALVHDPKLVVCDEPTSALDSAGGSQVMQMFRDVAVQPGRGVIVVTHDERAYRFADRMVEMEDGRIAAVRVTKSAA
jgi:putative ABC transport system ATP-binding protein